MPTFVEHEAQAVSNIAFVDEIFKLTDENGLKFPDWYATVCFYAAVHVIEAEIYQMSVVYFCYGGRPMAISGKIRHSSDFKKFLDKTTLPTSPHFYRRLVVDDDRNGFPKDVVNAYNSLYEYSSKARYECYKKCHKNVKRSRAALDKLVAFHKSKYQSVLS